MQDLNAMQRKHTNMQKLKTGTDVQFLHVLGLFYNAMWFKMQLTWCMDAKWTKMQLK